MLTNAVVVAASSPPGHAARGMVRGSGTGAVDVLAALVAHGGDDWMTPRRVHTIHLRLGGATVPAIAVCYRAPRSYTGEDAFEVQVAGNPLLLDRVVDALVTVGRAAGLDVGRASAGEFTARAFFAGRIDLTEAEGVAATISARSDAELRAAAQLRGGYLGRFAGRVAEDLAGALALVEAGIDFTDQEDVVAIAPADLLQRVGGIIDRVGGHLARAVGQERLRAIPSVVLAGPPNAGKSTLFNALLGRRRAVVSDARGTTRDVLVEPLTLETTHGSAEVLLTDLPGEDEGGTPIDAAMQCARVDAIRKAALVVHCVPPGAAVPRLAVADEPTALVVRTKADTTAPVDGRAVCALDGTGLESVRAAIARRLGDAAVSLEADAVALAPRHEAALRSTIDHLTDARALAIPDADERSLRQPELVAVALRAALDAATSLGGRVTADDVLGLVFGSFCVGK